jgi:retron-type reverse transcriptase
MILLLKPGEPPHELTSYRSISLLPVVSKVFEKLLLNRILPLMASHSLISAHQFGFRMRHSTIEQTYRVVQQIHEALETKQYCSVAFLDISQAFDRVWHIGLLYKLRRALPLNYFLLLKSYILSRHFLVKVVTDQSALTSINAGVPQGSVLGPLLYLLYTADLPTSPGTPTATFADDTSILTMDNDPVVASQLPQTDLIAIQNRA